MTTMGRHLRLTSYRQRYDAHAARATCPMCHCPDRIAAVIEHEGQCSSCTLRLATAAKHAMTVLAKKDLGLRFRALQATNILAGGRAPRPVISLSRRPSRRPIGTTR